MDVTPATEPAPRRRRRVAVVVTLVAAIALGAVVAVVTIGQLSGLLRTSSGPSARPDPRIVVVDGQGALSTMDRLGASVITYPAAGVKFTFPAWSPDGTRIGAIGQAADRLGVYVFDDSRDGAAPAAPRIIYESSDRPPFYLYWTPDSRQLTFLTTESSGLAHRIASADGGAADAIIRQGAPLYWDWVDSGRLMMNIGAGAPGAFLGEAGLDGVSVEPSVVVPGVFRSPGVSHDGRYRAYLAPATGAFGSLVVEARDGSSRHEVQVFGPAAFNFEPSGETLAVNGADKDGSQPTTLPVGPLRVVDPASGAVRGLLDGLVVAFWWAPDGRTIAALRLGADDGGGIAAAGGGALRLPIAQGAGVGLQLVFVDVSAGSILAERHVRVSEMFAGQLLPFFDQYALSHRLWSPDGRSIVLPLADENGVDRLYVIATDGSEPRVLADGVIGFWSP
jgi:TolB protein